MDFNKLLEKIEKKMLSYDVESMSIEDFDKYLTLVLKYKDINFFLKYYSKFMEIGLMNTNQSNIIKAYQDSLSIKYDIPNQDKE